MAFIMLLFGVKAQDSPVDFTLEEAQQYAMKNSYVLKNTNMDISKAQKKVWETITIGLPQISADMNYTNNITAAKTPFQVAIIPKDFWSALGIPEDTPPSGTYPISFMQKFNSNYGFTVNQLIFDGSYIVGVGSSQVYLNLTKQAHEKTAIDIRDAVAQAYYLVLIGQENKVVMEENHENTRKLYKETKAYYENGFREEQDVDQIRLMVKKAENEIIKAKREINISKIVLKYAMGYPIESQISLTENLDQFLVPLFEEKSGIGFDHSTHIDYKLSETNYLVSKKLLNLEKAAFLPRISMFYNWNKTAYSDNSNLFKSTASWFPSSMLGFNISVPIFNSGQKYLKVKQAQIDVNKAAVDKTFATVTLQKNYLTAKAELETAIEKFGNDKENRTLSEKILGKAKIKFNNGITSSTELSQIETQYIQTYGAYIGSALQLLQADLSLKKALGKL
jgi:outer membrane protein TolC